MNTNFCRFSEDTRLQKYLTVLETISLHSSPTTTLNEETKKNLVDLHTFISYRPKDVESIEDKKSYGKHMLTVYEELMRDYKENGDSWHPYQSLITLFILFLTQDILILIGGLTMGLINECPSLEIECCSDSCGPCEWVTLRKNVLKRTDIHLFMLSEASDPLTVEPHSGFRPLFDRVNNSCLSCDSDAEVGLKNGFVFYHECKHATCWRCYMSQWPRIGQLEE